MKAAMKKYFYLILMTAFVSCSPVVYESTQTPPPQQVVYVNSAPGYNVFYDDLSPYGSWVEYPDYGYVWLPRVSSDFAPYYSGGHWVYTEYGWTWFSNYSWGWAPFHYGSWFFDDHYGWLWVPGNNWAPAWVVWGQYDNYYGWAPVGPDMHKYEGYRPHHDRWHFVHSDRITENNITNYVVNNNTVVNNNITIINNYNTYKNASFSSGPKKDDVEKIIKRKIVPVDIKESDRPLPSKELKSVNKGVDAKGIDRKLDKPVPVYRPSIKKDSEIKKEDIKFVPKKVEKLENIKTIDRSSKKINDKNARIQEKQPKKVNASPAKSNNELKDKKVKQDNLPEKNDSKLR